MTPRTLRQIVLTLAALALPLSLVAPALHVGHDDGSPEDCLLCQLVDGASPALSGTASLQAPPSTTPMAFRPSTAAAIEALHLRIPNDRGPPSSVAF
jgi:hypothetical protein